MPESGILLNPGAGGDNLDAWHDSVSGKKTQSVRQKDSRGGRLYTGSSGLITLAATANLRLFGMFNPATSGMTMYVKYVYAWTYATAAAALLPTTFTRTSDTVTTGTVITPARPDNVSPLGNLAAIRSLPTTGTASGGAIARNVVLPPTANQVLSAVLHDSQNTPDRDLLIPAGQGILLAAVGTPNANHRLVVEFVYEEA